MNLNFFKTVEFFYSVGYITLLSSVITLILTGIIKLIFKQAKIIIEETNPIKKDILLSRIGRVIALITYASLYVIDVLVFKKIELRFTEELITSLLSGSALTLCISKGLYTGIRQMEKKNSVFEKLEVAEVTINKLQEDIKEINTNVSCNDEEKQRTTFVLGKKEK